MEQAKWLLAQRDLLEDLGSGEPWRSGDVLDELVKEQKQQLRARSSLQRCALYARQPEVLKLQDQDYMSLCTIGSNACNVWVD